ncbi:MAG: putative toxin-antitoxin system toxin component, PIN family [Acidobacteriaceae bacterium]|nr:putative toxin-antitoxin system toxin component, PIN family [Acidobacteriaceae bacterium]
MLSSTADTNIYISGLNFGGLPRRFLNLAEAGVFRLAVSEGSLAEIAKVLAYEKTGWPAERIQQTIRQLRRFAEMVQPMETLQVITADPPNNRILECAMAAGSQYLITGDNHLLRLQQYGETRIVKLAEFMEILQSESGAPGLLH